MNSLSTDTQYWNNKFTAFMHDPFDKVFRIPGHEERAAELIKQYGLDMPNEKFWKKADSLAAGFERGQVPSYHKDENKNGAVNYLNNTVLTHPTSDELFLNIKLPEPLDGMGMDDAESYIYNHLNKELKKLIGSTDDQSGYSGKFEGDPDRFAIARFFYTYLRLRFILADNNVASFIRDWSMSEG